MAPLIARANTTIGTVAFAAARLRDGLAGEAIRRIVAGEEARRSARPWISATQSNRNSALLFGLFSLIYGISQIVTGAELRRTGGTLNSVLEDAA